VEQKIDEKLEQQMEIEMKYMEIRLVVNWM